MNPGCGLYLATGIGAQSPLTRTILRVTRKVCEIVTKPYESTDPDNNGGDVALSLDSTFVTVGALVQRLTETGVNMFYGGYTRQWLIPGKLR